MERIRDAIRLLAVVLTGPVSRRAVRPRGDEARRALAGDELLPSAKLRWTHAITIRARPAEIWPWLVQMGCRRAGWYSYDSLDNGGVPAPECALVLGDAAGSATWACVLDPVDATGSRLVTRVRGRFERVAIGLFFGRFWRPIHFGMQRRQLLNIRQRVEAGAR